MVTARYGGNKNKNIIYNPPNTNIIQYSPKKINHYWFNIVTDALKKHKKRSPDIRDSFLIFVIKPT